MHRDEIGGIVRGDHRNIGSSSGKHLGIPTRCTFIAGLLILLLSACGLSDPEREFADYTKTEPSLGNDIQLDEKEKKKGNLEVLSTKILSTETISTDTKEGWVNSKYLALVSPNLIG